MSAAGCNNENALRTTFEVSQLMARIGKPHTITEDRIGLIQFGNKRFHMSVQF